MPDQFTRCSSEDGGEHLPAKALKRGLKLMTWPPVVYLIFPFLAVLHEHFHLLMFSMQCMNSQRIVLKQVGVHLLLTQRDFNFPLPNRILIMLGALRVQC